jgi:putative hydroxymethylpyrimidine transport system substrate-binding protein
MLGGFRNVEGVDLRLRGKEPVVTPVDQLGVPTYDELVLVARRQTLEEDAEPVRLFLAALARGTAAAKRDPAGTTKALIEANGDLDPKLTRAEVDATLPLLGGQRMDPARWKDFIAWMAENELIGSAPDPSEVLTNAYQPGTIPE